MKKTTLLILAILAVSSMYCQDIIGDWNGILKVQGLQLRLVFHISQTDEGYRATMDSPDQSAYGIPVTTTSFENQELLITVANLGVEYTGTLGDDEIITGTFKQAGLTIPLDLTREIAEKDVLKRPQEPAEPYPYYSEDIKFENKKENIVLAGTLTLPEKEGNFPAVILISGSGPQNRDEEIYGHKPFLVLADHLTKNGIAVLRFDDRGTEESEGDFTTATTPDFASDVEAALEYLRTRKEINKRQIGLIGHSEGGIIAPMVAGNSKGVSFIVLLAGSGIRGDQLLLMQTELLLKANGLPDEDIALAKTFNQGAYQIVIETENIETLSSELSDYFKQNLNNYPNSLKPEGMDVDNLIELQVNQLANPWIMYFLQLDPAPALEKVKCPVLAINGEKDLQVPSKVNLEAIENAVKRGRNKDVTIKEIPNLNHLFQECELGTPNEYAEIEQTFSPVALSEISNWILRQIK